MKLSEKEIQEMNESLEEIFSKILSSIEIEIGV